MNGAIGQIAMVPMATLTAASALRLRPAEPEIARLDGGAMPKAGLAGRMTALEGRLDKVLEGLDRLRTANASANAPIGNGLVNFYLGEMRVEIDLALLSLKIGDTTIDFSSMTRAVDAMARLTGDLVATLRGWAERVGVAIREAGERLLRPVRRVTAGVRTAVRWVGRRLTGRPPDPPASLPKALPTPDVPPPDFSLEKVRRRILAGETIPAAWVPFILALDFSETTFTDLSLLWELTALQTLVLWDTSVSDILPLSGLTELQSLDLGDTQMSDVSPLSGLTELQCLDLGNTRVSDVSPLSSLTALRRLDITGTQVRAC